MRLMFRSRDLNVKITSLNIDELSESDEYLIFLTESNELFAYRLLYLLKSNAKFRLLFYTYCSRLVLSQHQTILMIDQKYLIESVSNLPSNSAIRRRRPISLKFIDPHHLVEPIIRAWSSIVLSWLLKKYKYECYWAFLSTLGGAYSSLGEDSFAYAKQAEIISKKQLALATSFNDPNGICRCWLFLAFSCTQLKKSGEAEAILRCEYKKIMTGGVVTDDRLRPMCIAGLKNLKNKLRLVKKIDRCNKS